MNKENKLKQLTDYLLLNSSSLKDIGLFNGKMGVVVFFFHYARWTKEDIYREYAETLLEQIYEELNAYLPMNIQDGMVGIGWAIEYLNQQGFIQGDTDEALSDLDAEVIKKDIRRFSDFSLHTGLEGVLHYWLIRLKAKHAVANYLPFDKQYKAEIIETLRKRRTEIANQSLVNSFLSELLDEKYEYTVSIEPFINCQLIFDSDSINHPCSLHRGLIGKGLKEILK